MSNGITIGIPERLRMARESAGIANRGIASEVVPYSPETIGQHERASEPFPLTMSSSMQIPTIARICCTYTALIVPWAEALERP